MKKKAAPKITPVIMRCERQRDKVDKLVAHCLKLDGTKLHVIDTAWTKPIVPHTRQLAEAAVFGLHEAAAAFAGKPFMWLEVDSIPLQAGWLAALTKEYFKSKQQFLMASDTEPPNILVGGIGIYGPNTSWLIPKTIQKEGWGWDLWMMTHLSHMIAFTPLIQHRYCAEFHPTKHHTIRENEFPLDQNILRPEAVIFHADKGQTLIGGAPPPRISNEKTFRHNGDLGDIVAALPAIKQLGGGRIIICDSITNVPGLCSRESLKGARFKAIKPLLEAQPYITGVEWSDEPRTTTHEAVEFRKILKFKQSLADAQAEYLGIRNLNTSQWLTAPNVEQHGRVVIYRSLRYHNPLWTRVWAKIAATYGDRLLFIGLKEEHTAMEQLLGRKVERAPTPNLLEAARVIAGASLVFGNQTSLAWITMGLHKRFVEEVDIERPNSIILYPGAYFAGSQSEVDVVLAALDRLR